MPWSTLQVLLRGIATPLRLLISSYALLLALFTLLRLLRIGGVPLIDLANTFAPYLYMPLVVSFPLAIIVTRGSSEQLDNARKRLAQPARKREHNHNRAHPPRWSVLLQIGLLAIGLYWFALPSMYRPVEPPAGETFRVVSFNVQGSNAELERATAWLLQAAPDLIVLQETAEGYDPRLAPLYEVYAHEDHIEGSVRVFSRFAILQRDALTIEAPEDAARRQRDWLPRSPNLPTTLGYRESRSEKEQTSGRKALRLLLNLDGRHLAVYALHFSLPLRPRAASVFRRPDADIGPEALLRYDESRRNAQIRRFLAILDQETAPFIVAGDFNMSDVSLIYDEFAGRMQDGWRGAGNGAGRTWPVAEAIGLPRLIQPFLRIDYIWHSAALRAASAEVGEAIGSDHLPLQMSLEWRVN